jgi:hypothetical protein
MRTNNPAGCTEYTMPLLAVALTFGLSSLSACAGTPSNDPSWGDSGADDGGSDVGYPSFSSHDAAEEPSDPNDDAESGEETGVGSGGGSGSGGSGGGSSSGSGSGGGGGNGSSQGCQNPACFTVGEACGCVATGSNGDVFGLTCAEAGICGCFDDEKTLQAGVFFDTGACASNGSAEHTFKQYCQCK